MQEASGCFRIELQTTGNRISFQHIDHGRLLALDSIDGLLRTHGGQKVLIAESLQGEVRVPTDDPLAELNRLQAQSRLLSFRLEGPDLESVFLQLTGRRLRD